MAGPSCETFLCVNTANNYGSADKPRWLCEECAQRSGLSSLGRSCDDVVDRSVDDVMRQQTEKSQAVERMAGSSTPAIPTRSETEKWFPPEEAKPAVVKLPSYMSMALPDRPPRSPSSPPPKPPAARAPSQPASEHPHKESQMPVAIQIEEVNPAGEVVKTYDGAGEAETALKLSNYLLKKRIENKEALPNGNTVRFAGEAGRAPKKARVVRVAKKPSDVLRGAALSPHPSLPTPLSPPLAASGSPGAQGLIQSVLEAAMAIAMQRGGALEDFSMGMKDGQTHVDVQIQSLRIVTTPISV